MGLTVCNAPSRQLLDNGTYLTLVNTSHRLPANWLDKIELVSATNALGEEYQAEKETLAAFEKLRTSLLEDGIDIEADRAYSTDGDAQGSEYATGLAIDLFLMEDGTAVRDHAALLQKQDVFEKIHDRLADYGFVVRVLPGKEELCGMEYEPWHIRYVGTTAARDA